MVKHKILAAVAAAVFLGACSESDETPKEPIKQGREIAFGAVLDTKMTATRTYYGQETTNGSGVTVWPIYWNYTGTPDKIYIYSPQAAAGRNQQAYQVNASAADLKTAASLTRLGDFGIQAGTAATYDFYGFYPAGAKTADAEGTTVHATLPGYQSVTFAGTTTSPSTQIPAPTTGAVDYITSPDMNCCLLTTKKTGVTVTDEPVNLEFSPFSTVLDITIPGPVDNNTLTAQNLAAVTSVQVTANAPISGDFAYDFETETFTFGDNASNTIYINTQGYDADGNIVGIPLQNDNTLRLQAFILPNPAVTSLTVKVNTSDNALWTKNLNLTAQGSSTSLLQASKIHKAVLPKLAFAEAKFDYSTWISQMDPRIYISELSLPGTVLSFNESSLVSGGNITQTLDIAGQFNAGVRVFQCHAWIEDVTSSLDGSSTSIMLNSNGVSTGVSLYKMVQTLCNEIQTNHADEFCVLLISDYKGSTYSFADYYSRLKVITDELGSRGLLATNVDANTTIADVKGKVVLKIQVNGNVQKKPDESSWSTPNQQNVNALNYSLDGIQAWSNLNGADALFNWFTSNVESQVMYAPLVFGNVGSFTYTQAVYSAANPTKPVMGSGSGLSYDCANAIITTTTTSGLFTTLNPGNANCATVPSNMGSGMWFVYMEQNTPSTSQASSMVSNVANAINSTYVQSEHNKFYMIYGGGMSTTTTTTQQITAAANSAWETAKGTLTNKPYGWVLFNDVTANDSRVKGVISNNNDNTFKLARNKTATPVQASPSGDVQGTTHGGSLF